MLGGATSFSDEICDVLRFSGRSTQFPFSEACWLFARLAFLWIGIVTAGKHFSCLSVNMQMEGIDQGTNQIYIYIY